MNKRISTRCILSFILFFFFFVCNKNGLCEKIKLEVVNKNKKTILGDIQNKIKKYEEHKLLVITNINNLEKTHTDFLRLLNDGKSQIKKIVHLEQIVKNEEKEKTEKEKKEKGREEYGKIGDKKGKQDYFNKTDVHFYDGVFLIINILDDNTVGKLNISFFEQLIEKKKSIFFSVNNVIGKKALSFLNILNISVNGNDSYVYDMFGAASSSSLKLPNLSTNLNNVKNIFYTGEIINGTPITDLSERNAKLLFRGTAHSILLKEKYYLEIVTCTNTCLLYENQKKSPKKSPKKKQNRNSNKNNNDSDDNYDYDDYDFKKTLEQSNDHKFDKTHKDYKNRKDYKGHNQNSSSNLNEHTNTNTYTNMNRKIISKKMGKELLLVSAIQLENNCRFIFSSSSDILSDMFFLLNGENKHFTFDIIQWNLNKKGIIRYNNFKIYKKYKNDAYFESVPFFINEEVHMSLDLYELQNNYWIPYKTNDIQFEVYKIKIQLRDFLDSYKNKKQNPTYFKNWKLPPKHGIYKIQIYYLKKGYNILHLEYFLTVRNYVHFDKKKKVKMKDYPFYFYIYISLLAFFFFVLFFIFDNSYSERDETRKDD